MSNSKPLVGAENQALQLVVSVFAFLFVYHLHSSPILDSRINVSVARNV